MLKQLFYAPKNFLNNRVKVLTEKSLRNYGYIPISETLPQDIFIVGYPKSGNTWVQFMLTSLVYGILPERLNVSIVLEFVPDVHYKKIYKRHTAQCFFKSHALPSESYRKVIYLVRDGRDAMVSYFHMNKVAYVNYTFDDLLIKQIGLFPCKWHEHVRDWVDNPFDAEILFVRYEDLKTAPLENMRRVCAFAGLDRSDDEINSVINGCSIDKLRKIESEQGLGDANYKWVGQGENTFFRKGQVGGHVKEFPPHLIEGFINESRAELQKFNYLVDTR